MSWQTPPQQPPQWQPQPSPQPLQWHPPVTRGSKSSWIIAITTTVILLSGLIICGVSNRNTSTNVSSSSSNPDSTQPIRKVGDTITQDGISCKLISFDNSIQGLITVHIQLINHTSNEFPYYVADFHIKDQTGVITDASDTYSQLSGNALAPGGSIEGDIGFLVGNSHQAKLLWQPGSSNSLSNLWQLSQ